MILYQRANQTNMLHRIKNQVLLFIWWIYELIKKQIDVNTKKFTLMLFTHVVPQITCWTSFSSTLFDTDSHSATQLAAKSHYMHENTE